MKRQKSQRNAGPAGSNLGSHFRRATTKHARKSGLPPGTMVHVGKERTGKVRISMIDYDEADMLEKEVISVDQLHFIREKPTVTWLNVDGVHDLRVIENVGRLFTLHPLFSSE